MSGKLKAGVDVLRKSLPSILTGVATVGVAATGLLVHKATNKTISEAIISVSDAYAEKLVFNEETARPSEEILKELYRKNWKNYIPAAVSGAITIASIIGANKIHLSREAVMAAAVAFYKASGEEFEDAIFDKFADSGLKANVLDETNQPLTSNMKLRIWEPYTKQYFEASQQEILWAELTANKMLHQGGTVSVNDVLKLYSDPKIKLKKSGDKIGWSWDDDSFNELAGYYYAGGWIDMCPQFEERNGVMQFVMEYGIHPNDISESVR